RDEPLELVEMQDREAAGADRAQIAAAPLHRQHARRFAGQRIRLREFGARVAAAEVRDAQVLAEEVRSVPQQLQRLRSQASGFGLVPEVFQEPRFDFDRLTHNSTPRNRETGGTERPTARSPSARNGWPETSAR